MNLKFCTIGCGGHADTAHGPAQRAMAAARPGIRLAACCDIDGQRAAAYAAAHGFARHYTDIDTMLERERPDIVALVLPTALTAEYACPLLERGVPLLLEKPPGLTQAELQALIRSAEIGGGPHLVAFNRRHMPIISQARTILDEMFADEGPLQIAYDLIRHNRRDRDFSTTAIHGLDAALFLAGSPLRSVRLEYQERPDIAPHAVVVCADAACDSGARIRWNFNPFAGLIRETIAIHGRNRSLRLDLPVRKDGSPGSLELWERDRLVRSETYAQPDQEGFLQETLAFVDAVAAGTPAGPLLKDCVQQVELMEAMRARRETLLWSGLETTQTSGLPQPLGATV